MSGVPPDPETGSPTPEELLACIRAGLEAEDKLIVHYETLYSEKDSILLGLLKTLYGSRAHKVGTDPLSQVGTLFAIRRKEIQGLLRHFVTPQSFEAYVEHKVRQELWKLDKQRQRSATAGSAFVEGVAEKGFQPGSQGDPLSSILFQTWNEQLESAIDRIQRKDKHQQRLDQVLARLYVLKGWRYEKLAKLVFGPGQTRDQLKLNGDRIRKWIQEPIRHIKEGRNGGQEPPPAEPPDHPGDEESEDERTRSDEKPTLDDPP